MADPRATRILVWMCVFIAVNQLGFGAIVPVVALYARSFGVRQAAIGVAIAVYGLARFLVAVPVGKLTDVLGRRTALALGGVVTAAGNLLCAYAPDFTIFVAARFVAGVGAALVLIAGQIVLADITTPERRGRVMAIYQGVFLFAVGVGPYPGGLLAERFGLAAPFVVYAGAGLIASAVAWLQIPDTREPHVSAEAATTLPPFAAQVRLLTAHRGFLLVSLVGFVNAVVRTGALFNVVPVLARDRLLLGTDRIGFGLALSSVVGLVLAYPAGLLVCVVPHGMRRLEHGRRRERRRPGGIRGRRRPRRHERGRHEHLSHAFRSRLRDRSDRARRRHRRLGRRCRADDGGRADARGGRALRPLRAGDLSLARLKAYRGRP
jgi:MFS family permease